MAKVERALISVSDKTGIAELAKGLAAAGVEILSTGGTAKAMREAGVPVVDVAEFTESPEVMDGRVKTLHPRIHGGILMRDTASDRDELASLGGKPIDLVVVNLYPFEQTVARGAAHEEVIENIDIGGPSMVRSAAKNHARVAIVTDPGDYAEILEAVRGEGGELLNLRGESFMEGVHPLKSLAPRDIVARAIDSEMKKSGESCVFLDITHKPAEEIRERFPNIHEKCLSFGIDITKDRIPVVPAAHYACGGVFTDTSGRTDIRGLFAAGEVTCTGLHGSNRLASNSLLEALVFSDRALKAVTDEMDRSRGLPDVPDWQEDNVFNTEEWVLLEHDREEIRSLMWDYVGIVRTDFRLKRAARRIGVIAQEVDAFYKRTKVTEALVELRNVVTVAALTVRCALKRKESRGLHFNADYPDRIDGKEPSDTILSARETWVIPPP